MNEAGEDPFEIEAITRAVGATPRVLYEDLHVYPLSAPDFTPAAGALRERLPPGPIRLYVHVPFCNYACTFCFYAKRIGAPRSHMERYVDAVEREMTCIEPGTALSQLYLGGGTPTALPADLLDRLLARIHDRLAAKDEASLTVETSPESLTVEHVRVLRDHGVNRVSMGIESLDVEVLGKIHRRHSPEQALDACSLLVQSGRFVNVDFIYGLPRQTEASFARDLEAAAQRGVHSFTLYNLRLNEFTPAQAALRDVERMDLPRLIRWRSFAKDAAAGLGYRQTRWHTFVRHDAATTSYDRAPCVDGFGIGRQLGLGPSAASHLGDTVYRNEASLDAYVERMDRHESPVAGIFSLDENDRRTLFIARSLGDGGHVDLEEYASVFDSTVEADFGPVLERLRAGGLLTDEDGRIGLSARGKLVYDLALLAFYPTKAQHWLNGQQSVTRKRRHAAIDS